MKSYRQKIMKEKDVRWKDLIRESKLTERTMRSIESGAYGHYDSFVSYVQVILKYLDPIDAMSFRGEVLEDIFGNF